MPPGHGRGHGRRDAHHGPRWLPSPQRHRVKVKPEPAAVARRAVPPEPVQRGEAAPRGRGGGGRRDVVQREQIDGLREAAAAADVGAPGQRGSRPRLLVGRQRGKIRVDALRLLVLAVSWLRQRRGTLGGRGTAHGKRRV